MNKTMNCFFFSIAFLVSTKGVTTSEPFKKWMLTSYELFPGKALMLRNSLPNTITSLCHMNVVSSQSHNILIKVLSGSGQINGTSVAKGQTLVQTVQNMQVIPVTANSGAKAELTNLGPYTVTASCG
ncbi:hypothetical protein TUM19329_04460 [Legionella antarctica]|uniref:Uncharacterized protein n=1 Tax=Legionella antarctica TaxID=2708020 RepID=A0A6F8T0B2_9GAMM|nr:hypothetical protein [Legionella antarctica]BCA94085.1 hypothetical protein TUM19329_04460 [Legionella antarctica]